LITLHFANLQGETGSHTTACATTQSVANQGFPPLEQNRP